ncbi:MAG: Asp-tRNA(Asn)/Glu-tRNA(Gln) amidotransferase subunit GatB [Chloroflexi bacterium]|nr:Asp-tRNA(Asn)/Glu-tRNA(Gln) amidotransferase subunit GatB [Chloroflexota bacterium]
MEYEAVVGLEVHAELATSSKMFCACPVVDSTRAEPNTTVCPVCCGMPGVLPVVNQKAVDYGIRVALALECQVAHTSLFARKNYFYPDLPKGYQISQYEYPLAEHGRLYIRTAAGERAIRVHRVHLEEDTGKLTHVQNNGHSYSLVDLNRAGVPLLEIVSEPDMHTVEEVRAYAAGLRAILRCLGVNSGDMEKGVIRFEANVSIRPQGSQELGTRVEIKNLNSFRALERSMLYEVERQQRVLESGGQVRQETLGWNEAEGVTFSQRSKEEAHDYRYFPEPDLPPLVVEEEWVERLRAAQPELPFARMQRFEADFGLPEADARLLVEEVCVADYFEQAVQAAPDVPARSIANWMTGELFAWVNQCGEEFGHIRVSPQALADLVNRTQRGEINQNTAKTVLSEMLESGRSPAEIIQARGLGQISDAGAIGALVTGVLEANPKELASYLAGKETLSNWFFGQVMRAAKGQGNPQVIRAELERQLQARKAG